MIRFICILLFIPILADAQPKKITADPLWLHQANPDEDDIDSRFPIIQSSDPAVAQNINMVLQMAQFGYVFNDLRKADLLKAQGADPSSRTNLDYTFTPQTDRLITIDISTFYRNNTMSMNGYYTTKRYYFDTDTGQQIHYKQLFTEAGYHKLTVQGIDGLRASFIEVMKRYDSKFDGSQESINNLDAECECNCAAHINNAFCSDETTIDLSPNALTISTSDCDWMNPRSHDTYQVQIGKDKIMLLLSDYGKYVLFGGTPVVNPSPLYKLWRGTLGGKIKISFMLKAGCDQSKITGSEIYDKHGVCIPLAGRYGNQTLIVDELDDKGNKLATIEATLKDGKLTGMWKKADGSKTLVLEASAN
jgi:hypothetical protein